MAKALYGAYLLAKAEKDGMSYFDKSLDGFWRSFLAAAIVAPIFFLLMTIRFVNGGVGTTALRFTCIETIAYIIGWFFFSTCHLLSGPGFREREAIFWFHNRV